MVTTKENIRILKNHNALSKFKDFLRNRNPNITEKELSVLGFVYPKTICLQPESSEVAFTDDNRNTSLNIVSEIINYIGSNKELTILLDLRKVLILFESKLQELIDGLCKNHTRAIVWVSKDTKAQIDDIASCAEIFYCLSEQEVSAQLNAVATNHSYQITFPRLITINTSLTIFNQDFERSIKESLLVVVDFRLTESYSWFSAQMIALTMISKSNEVGILWKASPSKQTDRLASWLNQLDMPHLTHSNDLTPPSKFDKDLFRLQEFNRQSFRETITQFGDWIVLLRELYGKYLDENIASLYEPTQVFKKPWVSRLPRSVYIKRTIGELIENAAIHSNGLGFFSARVQNGVLKIIIADTGVGLLQGILNNYQLNDMINTDGDALRIAFNLDAYRHKRVEEHNFNVGAGSGLKESFDNIFVCKGRFCCKTGSAFGTFLNPVGKTSNTPKVNLQPTTLSSSGTQYLIVFPLTTQGEKIIPKTNKDFLNNENI